MRRILAAAAVIASTSLASAQPADPYGEPEPTQDEVLNEQIAQSLVQRAQELYDARVFVDAKQLAVEALVKSPKGQAGQHARFLLAAINKQLGIADPDAKPDPQTVPAPVTDPVAKPPEPVPPAPEQPRSPYVTPARVHGALYAGLLGTTIGAFFSKDTPAGGAIPLGIVTGVVGGLYTQRLTDRLGWNDAQVMTAGAGSTWLGIMGGLVADAVKTDGTTARQVLVGASIGSTVGLAAGAALATRDNYTTGDLALVDTFAGIGVAGGFTVGMLMQPAESEAYSVNAVLGGAAGIVVGLVAAPNTNTTPRRMARVAGLAAAGGAVPFLLYAGIRTSDSKADERITGLLSTIGILGGAYLGFRLTRCMDEGLDVKPGDKPPVEDAPAAVLGRHSDGRWALGMIGVQPLPPELAPQPGLALPLVGGAF